MAGKVPMLEQTYHEKVKRFEQLIQEGQQWKDQDVARSLVAFRHARAIFPNAQGIDDWIVYLEAKLKQHAIQTTRASQAQLKAVETEPPTSSSSSSLDSSSASSVASTVAQQPVRTDPTPSSDTLGSAANHPLQDRVKEHLRQAEHAVKRGHISQALHLLDQALTELEQADGPPKVILRVLDRRNHIVPTAQHIFRSAKILQTLQEHEQALQRMDAALQIDPMFLECLWAKVDLAEQLSNPHQLISALMQLSDVYEKNGDFKAYDDVQRRARDVREKVNEWSGEFAHVHSAS